MLLDTCYDSVTLTKKPLAVINKFRKIERDRDVLNPMKNASIESLLSGYVRKLIKLHNL
jgi:hypothetical protein